MKKQIIKTKFDKTFLIWFAGFFDGEGAFRIKRHGTSKNGRPSLHIGMSISNTDLNALKYIRKNIGGRIKERRRMNPRHKDLYSWSSTSTDSIQCITKAMFPYLIVKRERAKLILTFEKREHLIGQGTSKAFMIKRRKNDLIFKKQLKLQERMTRLNLRGKQL